MGQVLFIHRRTERGFRRSPNTGNTTNFRIVNSDGSGNNNNASNSYGVCLGLYNLICAGITGAGLTK